MPKATPISLPAAVEKLVFFGQRTPHSTAEESARAFAALSDFDAGAVYVGHWAGTSEWERHGRGDELLFVIDGATTLFLWSNGEENACPLGAGDLCVVPEGTWHRFETPERVQILSVTPQPTDHRTERPDP